MSVNPQAQAALDVMAEVEMDPTKLPLADMRALMAGAEISHLPEVGNVENRTVELGGEQIPLRIYSPATSGSSAVAGGAQPLIVYYHGGGWVLCDLDSHDSTCRLLCNEAQSVVVSVDYRLAPEARYPAAADDCYLATEWAVANAADLGADPNRLVVAGDSAGGNLAAAVSLMARDKAAQGEAAPTVKMQVGIYPVTQHKAGLPSYAENAEGYYLTASMMDWFWDQYLGSDADGQQAYASPLLADLHDMPEALIMTAEYDPLRDEGEAYAKKLLEAGCKTELIRYAGQIHGFVGMHEGVDDGRRALETIGARVREKLAS